MGGKALENAVKPDGYASEGANVFGGSGKSATENNVIINDSSATEVNGGYAERGNATGNKVQLTRADGEELDITGGMAEDGKANNNCATVSESSVRNVQGGKGNGESKGKSVGKEVLAFLLPPVVCLVSS